MMVKFCPPYHIILYLVGRKHDRRNSMVKSRDLIQYRALSEICGLFSKKTAVNMRVMGENISYSLSPLELAGLLVCFSGEVVGSTSFVGLPAVGEFLTTQGPLVYFRSDFSRLIRA